MRKDLFNFQLKVFIQIDFSNILFNYYIVFPAQKC